MMQSDVLSLGDDPIGATRVIAPSAGPESLRELLLRTPLFSGLDEDEIDRLVRHASERSVRKGDVLFHRGDPCHGFHLILSGQIKLAFSSAEGNEKVVEILGTGRSFGEAIMLMDKSYVLMAQALTDAHLIHVGKQGVFDEMACSPAFCRRLLAGLAQRLHCLMADVESYCLRSGRERVIGYFLHLDESDAVSAHAGRISLRLPASKGTIASRLNLTREHFSRILHELAEADLIRVDGRIIHIPDLALMRDKSV